MDNLKRAWLWMLEPPWRHSGGKSESWNHWQIWLVGWLWAFSGVVLGATVAPSLVQLAGLSNAPYQNAMVITIAVLAGFVVQFLGWFVAIVLKAVDDPLFYYSSPMPSHLTLVRLWPLGAVCYGIYRYFTIVGVARQSAVIAFVGGLLVKTVLIPFTKAIITGAVMKMFIRWLRGSKTTAA